MAKKKVLTDEEALRIRTQQLRKAMGLKDDKKEKDEKKDEDVLEELSMADQYIAVKDVWSTGIPELDRLMTPLFYAENGRGGIPKGYVVELFGPQGGGKTSLAMKIMSSVTQAKGLGLWVDGECCFVSQWASAQGNDNSHIAIMHNNGQSGEYFLEKIRDVARSGTVDLIVVDSLTSLQPKEIQEKPLEEDARVGKVAALLSRALPSLITAAKLGQTSIVLINQVRDAVGVKYGNPEQSTGGKALKFYVSLRIRINCLSRKDRCIVKDGEPIGIRSNAQIVKSRFGPPFTDANVPFYFNRLVRPLPIDVVLDEALIRKIIKTRKTQKVIDGEPVYSFSFDDLHGAIPSSHA